MTTPFEPESDLSLKNRFAEALTPVFDVVDVINGGTRPAQSRKHVFDFEDGFRAIVSIERMDKELFLHMSFSSFKQLPPVDPSRARDYTAMIVAKCHGKAKELSGARLAHAHVKISGAGVVHLIYPAEQVAR